MAKGLNKSLVFFKNLFRPPVEIPYKDKKLTIFHKIIVRYVLKSRTISEIPDTISYYEWNIVKKRLHITKLVLMIMSPVFLCATLGRYAHARIIENLDYDEKRKFGEVQR